MAHCIRCGNSAAECTCATPRTTREINSFEEFARFVVEFEEMLSRFRECIDTVVNSVGREALDALNKERARQETLKVARQLVRMNEAKGVPPGAMSFPDGRAIYRMDDGSVRIYVEGWSWIEFAPDDWVSAVTSVALDADTAQTHTAVEVIHKGVARVSAEL